MHPSRECLLPGFWTTFKHCVKSSVVLVTAGKEEMYTAQRRVELVTKKEKIVGGRRGRGGSRKGEKRWRECLWLWWHQTSSGWSKQLPTLLLKPGEFSISWECGVMRGTVEERYKGLQAYLLTVIYENIVQEIRRRYPNPLGMDFESTFDAT